jgi:hypothetical protein
MLQAFHHLAGNLPLVAIFLSLGSLVASLLSLLVSLLAKRQAKNAALLGHRHEGINHIRTAIYDVTLDGNITAETVTSIREALQLSLLVFSRKVRDMLEPAHKIALRLQSRPSERQTDQDDRDRDALAKRLEAVLRAMNKEAALGK